MQIRTQRGLVGMHLLGKPACGFCRRRTQNVDAAPERPARTTERHAPGLARNISSGRKIFRAGISPLHPSMRKGQCVSAIFPVAACRQRRSPRALMRCATPAIPRPRLTPRIDASAIADRSCAARAPPGPGLRAGIAAAPGPAGATHTQFSGKPRSAARAMARGACAESRRPGS